MGSVARNNRGSSNVKKLGIIVYDNPRLLTVLKDLLASGYEWRLTTEVRKAAGLSHTNPANNAVWHSFTSVGINGGYFETRREDSVLTKYYIKPANGGLEKIQKVIEWVERNDIVVE